MHSCSDTNIKILHPFISFSLSFTLFPHPLHASAFLVTCLKSHGDFVAPLTFFFFLLSFWIGYVGTADDGGSFQSFLSYLCVQASMV